VLASTLWSGCSSRPTALRSSCKGLGWTRPRLLISLWRYSWSVSAIAAYLFPWSTRRRLDCGAILALVAQQEQRLMRRTLRRLTAATVKARDQQRRGTSGSNRTEAPHVELVSVRPQRQRGTMGASVRWLPRPAVHRPHALVMIAVDHGSLFCHSLDQGLEPALLQRGLPSA
jgi:hypothetical protein